MFKKFALLVLLFQSVYGNLKVEEFFSKNLKNRKTKLEAKDYELSEDDLIQIFQYIKVKKYKIEAISLCNCKITVLPEILFLNEESCTSPPLQKLD